ncbi:MAG: hypothetical protein WAN50_03775 [Minisyncoccia bacterium]
MHDKTRLNFIQRFFSFIGRSFIWIVLLFAAAILFGVYELGRYSVYQANPGLANAEQANSILENVGKLINLPNETPTMATIKDAISAKQGQPFLVDAEDGDVLIVYPNAAQAFLYRPSVNKLINVGPVTNGGNSPAIQQPSAPAKSTAEATSSNDTGATSTKTKK